MSLAPRALVRSVALAAALLALGAAPAALRAQTTATPAASVAKAPDLTGTWELDVAKSEFGMVPPPQKSTIVVEHKEPTLKVTTTSVTQAGERSTTSNYTTDGKESKNQNPNGSLTSTMKWEGATLVHAGSLQVQGNDVKLAERWTVAPDGKVLTVERHIATMMGEMEMKMVYAKK
jgi:hypothetical protein